MEITPQEVKKMLEAGTDFVLVDVREAEELELCCIEGAVHLALSQFAGGAGMLDPQKPVITFCHHGVRSLNAARALLQMGFGNVKSMKGGIELWSLAVDPKIPRY